MDLTLYNGKESYLILGDIIDKHLTQDEQLIAEALSKVFYNRAKEQWEKKNKDPYLEWHAKEGVKYLDFYKFMAHQMVAKCKGTEASLNEIAGSRMHSWKELLIILFGKELESAIKAPWTLNYE